MNFYKFRRIPCTADAIREQWLMIITRAMVGHRSIEHGRRGMKVLEDATLFATKKWQSGELCYEAAVGFVESALTIYHRTGCYEHELVYKMFNIVNTCREGEPEQPITELYKGSMENNDYDYLVDIFVKGYCGSDIALNRHPSRRAWMAEDATMRKESLA